MAKSYGDLYNIADAPSYASVTAAETAYQADPTPANHQAWCDAINTCLTELGSTQRCMG